MDRYMRRNMEDLVVPNYQETSDSYPSPDIFSGWNMNSSEAAEKCFDYDVINHGFSGGLYSHQMDTSEELVEEEAKRLKSSGGGGCFFNNNSASSLHDFDGIQQMDDMFLNSILEDDVPGNENLDSFKEMDNNNNSTGSSSAYDGREVPMFNYNWEACQDIPFMEEEEAPVKMEEPSAEEVVLQDLQRASEMLTDDTRKCFRDTFYRLAKNSQQILESDNTNSEEDKTSKSRNQKTESETNSIDRAIANLTFNKMEANMRNMPAPKRLSTIQG